MAFGKRIVLFLATNLLIILTISVVMSVLGIGPYLTRYGINYTSLAIFALLWGMGGAFISLAISKWMAIRATGAHVIDEPRGDAEAWLVETVRRHARAAGIGMPQVAIFPSDAPNASANAKIT